MDENFLPTARVEAGDGSVTSVSVDVTEIVRAWADADLGKNGFLLTVPPSQGEGLDGEESAALGESSEATLHVDYRKISGLGFRGGSKALDSRVRAKSTTDQ